MYDDDAAATASAASETTTATVHTHAGDDARCAGSKTTTHDTPPTWPLAGYDAAQQQQQRQRNAIMYDNTKAGLQVVDKRKVEDVIRASSEGSPYYANEQRKLALRQRRLQRLLQRSREYDRVVLPSAPLRGRVQARVDAQVAALETTRRFDRILVHIDMDMFYAAVEEKKNPQLRGVPFGVGTQHMLSTTNYIARQYGVRSGMPGFIGKKLCPELRIVPTDFAAYRREAAVVRAIAAEYDPHFVSIGLDELTMDVTAYVARRLHTGTAPDDKGHMHTRAQTATSYACASAVVQACRERIHAATSLTCSGGIAPTATLAKIASNVNKPNGQHELCLLSRDEVLRFVATMPVRRVPGIGPSHEFTLTGLGMATVGDMYAQRYRLSHLFTPKTFAFFLSIALGLSGFFDSDTDETTATGKQRQGEGRSSSSSGSGDDAESGSGSDGKDSVKSEDEDDDNDGEDDEDAEERRAGGVEGKTATAPSPSWRKSIGQEHTFSQLTSALELQRITYSCLRVAHERMVRYGFLCGHVVLKTKHRSFRVHQYSKTCAAPSDDADELRRVVDELLLPLLPHFADYRLLGVRLDKLVTREELAQAQLQLPQQRRTLVDLFRATSLSSPPQHGKRRRDETTRATATTRAADASSADIVVVDVTDDDSSSSSSSGEDSDVQLVTPTSRACTDTTKSDSACCKANDDDATRQQ